MEIRTETENREYTINGDLEMIEEMLSVAFSRLFERKNHRYGSLINFESIAASLDSFYESQIAHYEFSCRYDEDLTEQQRRGLEILISNLEKYYSNQKKELLNNGYFGKKNNEDIVSAVNVPSIDS